MFVFMKEQHVLGVNTSLVRILDILKPLSKSNWDFTLTTVHIFISYLQLNKFVMTTKEKL